MCRTPREFLGGLSELERHRDRCIIRAVPGRWFPTDGKPVYRLSDPQSAYTDDGGDGRRVLPKEVRDKGRKAEIGTTLLDTIMLPMFVEEPTPWVMIDWDGIEFEPDWRDRLAETADRLKLRLPDEFADASCWYQATGGAADPFKHDLGGAAVRMRTVFVLSRPLTHDQLERWLGGIPGLDPCTFRTNQEIYVGRPVFAGGLVDPMPVRSGVLEGLEDVVQVPDDLPEPRARRATPAFVPAAGELGTEGLGLLDCPAFDRALDEIDGASGSVRDGLGRAAWIYAMGVGPAAVDVAALAARLAEVGRRHRSPDEVEGYGLDRLVQRKLEQAAARTEEEKRQAAEGAEIFARMGRARPGEERPEPDPEPPQKPALPDFGPVEPDRDAALARMHADLRGAVERAGERVALRRELSRRRKAACDEAKAVFYAEVGKVPDEDGQVELSDDEKRRLRNRVAKASRASRLAFLEEHGLKAMPPREAPLFTGAQGTGKTQVLAQALARLEGGNVLVHEPTIKKAEELAAAIEACDPGHMFTFVYRGRTQKNPRYDPAARPDRDFNTGATSARMCIKPKGLITAAQGAGVPMRKGFCSTCPQRLDCPYLNQIDTIKRYEGRRIVIAAHEGAFMPMAFASDLVVADEDIATKALRVVEIDPGRLLDPDKWQGASYQSPAALQRELAGERVDGVPLDSIARKVGEAMDRQGGELAALREAGVDKPVLKACAAHLKRTHETLAEEIAAEGAGGAPETRMSKLVDALRAQELRALAMLFDNLRDELGTDRAGTNATRLVRGRRKLVAGREERLDRYVISRPRATRVGQGTEIILLDGTGSLTLNRALFGDDVEEHRTAVRRQGVTIQISSTTNSKNRLLAGPQAAKNRKAMARLIQDLDTLLDGSLLVGCTKALKEKLIEEGAIVEARSMHFGAERGMNSAEGLQGVLPIGREQPSVPVLEDLGRALTVTSPEPFVSVLDEKEGGFLPTFRRRRRMEPEVWADVTGHPDPRAQALLEQIREAGLVQMADRIRAVWSPKLTVIATDVPVDLDVDLLVTQGELMAAAAEVAVIARETRGRGWSLRAEPAGRGRDRIGRATAIPLIELLGKWLSLAQIPVLAPSGGNLVPGVLYATLPPAEALRRAAEAHPGLRAPPPEGGVPRECLRRHGVVGTWTDLPALVPDLAPDATESMQTGGGLTRSE